MKFNTFDIEARARASRMKEYGRRGTEGGRKGAEEGNVYRERDIAEERRARERREKRRRARGSESCRDT